MILKIVIPLLIVLCCYYTGLFIYYYRKTKKLKTALRNTVILLLPLLLVFFLIEFGFRILVSNKIMHLDKRFFTRNFATAYYFIHGEKQGLIRHIRLREATPNTDKSMYLGKDIYKENNFLADTTFRFRTDKDGFIIPEYTNGGRSIVFVGGSTTECMYVQEEKRFPYLVGKLLSKQTLQYSTKNAGVSGNNTYHSINTVINKALPYNPKAIVLMHAINDLNILMWEKNYHNDNPTKSMILDNISEKVTSGGVVDEFLEQRGQTHHLDTCFLFNQYRQALRLFIYTCKSQNIQPILMTQFNRIEYENAITCKQLRVLLEECEKSFPGVDYIALYKKMNQTIREMAKNENVALIDLDRLVPKTGTYIYDAVHLNDSGSIYVAGIVAEHLIHCLHTNDTTDSKKL